MGYSGMIGVIAQILVLITGDFYPLIAPLIGALGTFVTGSDTSANVLFGGLQWKPACHQDEPLLAGRRQYRWGHGW